MSDNKTEKKGTASPTVERKMQFSILITGMRSAKLCTLTDPAKDPSGSTACRPDGPTNGSVVVVVPCAKGEAMEEVAHYDGRIDYSNDDRRGQDEGEADLLEDRGEVRHSRSLRVLSKVEIDDDAYEGEEDELCDCHRQKSLGKVFWFFHLRDEGGVADLREEI